MRPCPTSTGLPGLLLSLSSVRLQLSFLAFARLPLTLTSLRFPLLFSYGHLRSDQWTGIQPYPHLRLERESRPLGIVFTRSQTDSVPSFRSSTDRRSWSSPSSPRSTSSSEPSLLLPSSSGSGTVTSGTRVSHRVI